MIPGPDTRYTRNADGLALAYQTLGEGPGDVVFLSDFGCIDLVWEDPEYSQFLGRLSGLGRLILLDPRGIGASDPVPLGGLPSPERWTDDLRVVLDAVESTRATVICSGLLGVMGMVFAATYPERTASLVLIDGFARLLGSEDYPSGATPEGLQAVVDLFGRTWGLGVSTAMSTPSRSGDEAFLRWLARTERLTASPAEVTSYWTWGFGLDLRQVLPVIGVPTLVVHNEPNPIPAEHSRYLAEHIQGAQLIEHNRKDSFLFSRTEGDRLIDHIEEFITGVPPKPRLDRALATVLFTDIVASTSMASELGDVKWASLLDRHDELLGHELDRHHGRKVVSTGDGVLATFDGPERAVRCAQSICRSVQVLGIDVRAGVHAGEVQRRGEDIAGLAVHIGARVANLAGAGEVFVSSTVKDLVAGSGIEFAHRGDHQLKGVPGSWSLYLVRADQTDRAEPGRMGRRGGVSSFPA